MRYRMEQNETDNEKAEGILNPYQQLNTRGEILHQPKGSHTRKRDAHVLSNFPREQEGLERE